MTSVTGERCPAPTRNADQCARPGTTVVSGIAQLLCKQHARIVATEPGGAGLVRLAPIGVQAIVGDLDRATTFADIDRCRAAITAQIVDCADQTTGLKQPLIDALRTARARVRGNS